MIARVAASMAVATRLIAVRGAQSSPVRLPPRLMGTSSRSPLSSLPSRVAAWFWRPFVPPPRKLWVKEEGDARFVGIRSRAEDVDALTREVAKEFPSLRETDLSNLTLHVAGDEVGKQMGAALKNDELLVAALASSSVADAAASATRIVIKVAPSLPTIPIDTISAPPRMLWVKVEGDVDYAVLFVEPTLPVGLIKKEIVKEFPSLRETNLSNLTLHVAGDEVGKQMGAALKNDELLDAALASSAAADAAASATRIVIKVAPPLPMLPIATIKYRMIGKKDVVEPLLRTQQVVSAAEFLAFILGKTLVHKREGARLEIVDAKTGKKKTTQLPDEEIGFIMNLPAALNAMQQEGTYLALRDPGFLFSDEVSNFKGFRDNIASAFEEESNKGIAINERLLDAYGSKLEVLNGGKGVIFYNEATGQAFLQCDGLIKNTSFILVNEAKTHLHEEDIQKFCKKTMPNFETVLASPSKYKSDPAGILEKLAGLTPVYIASCKGFTIKAKEDCKSNGIHLLESNGDGFKCTLHTKVVAAASTLAS